MKQSIEINAEFKEAIDLIEKQNQSVFITGKAGTGKSTLLEYFRSITEKNIVVLAPTGVSALNVMGQTIHSFFRFKPDITLNKIKAGKRNKIYRKLDAIVIDEISMVRADLMDCIDKFMRVNCSSKKPFAGKQMIFFGDLYQLPPVVTSKDRKMFKERYESAYFFSAQVMQGMEFKILELEKIYRQHDNSFIEILNSIRNNTVTDNILKNLNRRYEPDFKPPKNQLYVCLTTRNKQALEENQKMLKGLKGKAYNFQARVAGDFVDAAFPADELLTVKKHAQVMLLNNDSDGRWVNGSMGRIIAVDGDEEVITVELTDGMTAEVEAHEWDMFRYVYNENTKFIETKKIGSFTQFPLRLAWAVTIHKGQGKTFNNVILDISGGTFTPGQVYVGLSRCTSLDGLVLKKQIEKKHIFMDWKVVKFMTSYRYAISERNMPAKKKIDFIRDVINRQANIDMVYLKSNDEKSKRRIRPHYVGNMDYKGKAFTGIDAYCFKRKEMRRFRVDRILAMHEAD